MVLNFVSDDLTRLNHLKIYILRIVLLVFSNRTNLFFGEFFHRKTIAEIFFE